MRHHSNPQPKSQLVVADSALRGLVREALWNREFSGWSSNASGPAEVNSGVDPSAAETDPVNPSFAPQNKVEFGVAVRQLVRNLPDEEMPGLYDAVKTAVRDNEEKEDKATMTKQAAQGGTDQVEEAFRRMIRNVLREINPRLVEAGGSSKFRGPSPFSGPYKGSGPIDPDDERLPAGHLDDQGRYVPVNRVKLGKNQKPGPVVGDLPPVRRFPAGMSGGDAERRLKKGISDLKGSMGKAIDAYENPKPDPDDPSHDAPAAPQGGRGHAYKSTAIGGMSDVNYDPERGHTKPASFDEIADELGFAVSGAKQAVDKALLKARYVLSKVDFDNPYMSEDLDIIVLGAINDYIKKLSKVATPSDKLSEPDDEAVLQRVKKMKSGEPVDPDVDGDGDITSADIQLMKDHPELVEEMPGFREFLHGVIKKAMRPGQKLYNPLKDDDADVEPAADAEPAAPAPEPAPVPKASKSSFKIYPGASKYAGPDGKRPPAVTRVKGKVYRSGQDTKFTPGEQGEVSMDGDKLRVKKPGSDHTQTWEPVEEAKRPILYLRTPRGS